MIVLDRETRIVKVGQTEHRLTRGQFRVLDCLMARPRRIQTREELMDYADISLTSSDRAIDVYVKRLRKLGLSQIRTAIGEGYYWEE